MTRTKVEIEARRRVVAARRQLAVDIRRMREDAGVTQSRLSAEARIAQGCLSRIESDEASPSLEVYGRIGAALGADLACRVYPNTGPAIRDRHQSAIAQALLAATHPRWRPWLEVAVRRPARGWIDLVLSDAVAREMVPARSSRSCGGSSSCCDGARRRPRHCRRRASGRKGSTRR